MLVCGVRDIKLQRRLLAKYNLTLQIAMKEAQASETSSRSTEEIQRSNSLSTLWKMVSVYHMDEEEDEDIHQLKGTNKYGHREEALNLYRLWLESPSSHFQIQKHL